MNNTVLPSIFSEVNNNSPHEFLKSVTEIEDDYLIT